MKHLCKYILVALCLSLILSCSKDDQVYIDSNSTNIESRSSSLIALDLNTILSYEHFFNQYSSEYLTYLYDNYGDIYYSKGLILSKNDSSQISVSAAPLIKDSIVSAVILRLEKEEEIIFVGASLDDLESSVSDLVTKYSVNVTSLLLDAFKVLQSRFDLRYHPLVYTRFEELEDGGFIEPRCGNTLIYIVGECVPYSMASTEPVIAPPFTCEITNFDVVTIDIPCFEFDPSSQPDDLYVIISVIDPTINTGGGPGVPPYMDPIFDPNEEETCDGMISKLLMTQVNNLMGELSFPCEQDSPNDIKETILESWCQIANDSMNTKPIIMYLEDFEEGLQNYDYIEILDATPNCEEAGLSMEDDCPKLKNILDQLIGDDGSNPTCDLLSTIGQSRKVETTFIWDCDGSLIDDRPDGTTPNGQTDLNELTVNSGEVQVFLNMDLCNASCLEIASTILHEALHAEFITKIIESLPNPDPWSGAMNNTNDISNAWNGIRNRDYSGYNLQHTVMAKFYAEQYSVAMWKLVGMQGDSLDYLYWAYDGLAVQTSIDSLKPLLPQTEWDSLQNNWNNNISSQVDFDCN